MADLRMSIFYLVIRILHATELTGNTSTRTHRIQVSFHITSTCLFSTSLRTWNVHVLAVTFGYSQTHVCVEHFQRTNPLAAALLHRTIHTKVVDFRFESQIGRNGEFFRLTLQARFFCLKHAIYAVFTIMLSTARGQVRIIEQLAANETLGIPWHRADKLELEECQL